MKQLGANVNAVFTLFEKATYSFIVLYFFFSSISIQSQVVADFTSPNTIGCGLLELVMINNSTGATSYYWQVLNEAGAVVSTSSLTNPSFFLTTPGTYTVELTATSATGTDILSIPGFALVYTSPVANFISSATSGCLPLTITISDISIPGSFGSISEYYWIITGAGTLPSAPEIEYTFSEPGEYTVYLFVEDSVGCSSYFTTDIEVFPLPEVSFTADPTVACSLPLTTSFTNTTTGVGPLSFSWNFGDGSSSSAINPTHNYTSIGEYSVSLTATDAIGCINTITYDNLIIINSTLDVNFSASTSLACVGTAVEFVNLSDALVGTWLWDFGDGTTSTAVEPTHVYTAPGLYSVTLSGDFGGGCTGFISYPSLINVIASPVVSFTSSDPTSFCAVPLEVSFIPAITGGPCTLLWEFETPFGISTSTSVSPDFSWDIPGFYDVTLTATNLSGCSMEYTLADYISIGIFEVTPIADPVNGCIPLPVEFTAVSGAEITEYMWDFGDGFTSTAANPVHIYNSVGCFDVSIIAQTIDGCIDTTIISEMVCAGETGTASLSVPDTACPSVNIGVLYLPLDSLTATIDGGLDYSNSSNVDSITIIGMEPGYHDLVFYTWINGCPDSVVSSIFILEVVDSTLVYDINCINPYQVQFFIDTTLAAMSCGWVWDFGDGIEDSVSMNPIHTYAETGSYTVSIIYDCLTDTECSGEGLNIVITDPEASFEFGGLACDTPYTVELINTSTDGAGDDLTYFWNFGGGVTSTEENPLHTYTDYGEYLIYLQVTDANGCPNSKFDTIVVNNVEAGFTMSDDIGCIPFTFSLFDNSTSLFGDIVNWTIDWNDGVIQTFTSASEVVEVEHTYSTVGTYLLTLSVTDANGCTDSYIDTVKAKMPTVDFTADDLTPCIGQFVQFTELAPGSGLTFYWDFGDGTYSTEENPIHAYSTLSSYDVSLTITDSYGCSSTLVKPYFIVTETITADFSSEVILSNCNYSLVQFHSFIDDTVCSFYWDFGDGGVSVDPNPVYPYLEAGSYNVSLTVTDCNDCEVIVYKEGFIEVPGPYGFIVPSEDSVCVGEELILYLYIYSSDTAQLFFDNGDVSFIDVAISSDLTVVEIPYTYYEVGYFGPTALVVDSSGCINILYITDSILVTDAPVSSFITSDTILCFGSELQFNDFSYSEEPIVNWIWNTGESAFSVDSSLNFIYTYSDTGNYIATLEVQTAFGCSDISQMNIEIISYPLFNITNDTMICPGNGVQLSATDGYVYYWSPPEGLSSPVIYNPVANPDITTLYTVVISNGVCSLIDSVLIEVVDELILDAGPDTVLCLTGEVDLWALLTNEVPQNEILFYWQPDSFLNDIFIPDPTSNPVYTIEYTAYASCGLLDDSAIVYITVTGPPDIDIPVDTIITIYGQPVEINAEVVYGNDPLSHQWYPSDYVSCPNCLSITVLAESSMIVGILTTDSLGCTDYDYVYIKAVPCDESVFAIPNIISPNNDGFNDNFYIDYTGVAEMKSLTIFDRWGEVMFQSTDVERRWDGTHRGVICNPGVYVYAIEFICIDGNESVVSGNITLVK